MKYLLETGQNEKGFEFRPLLNFETFSNQSIECIDGPSGEKLQLYALRGSLGTRGSIRGFKNKLIFKNFTKF